MVSSEYRNEAEHQESQMIRNEVRTAQSELDENHAKHVHHVMPDFGKTPGLRSVVRHLEDGGLYSSRLIVDLVAESGEVGKDPLALVEEMAQSRGFPMEGDGTHTSAPVWYGARWKTVISHPGPEENPTVQRRASKESHRPMHPVPPPQQSGEFQFGCQDDRLGALNYRPLLADGGESCLGMIIHRSPLHLERASPEALCSRPVRPEIFSIVLLHLWMTLVRAPFSAISNEGGVSTMKPKTFFNKESILGSELVQSGGGRSE